MFAVKVYVVAEDTYEESYGAEIELFGVYTTKEQAEKRYNEIKTGNEEKYNDIKIKTGNEENYTYDAEYGVYENELDKDCRIFLGGYAE